MSFLDKVAAAISPKWGAKRAAWELERKRLLGYDAANSADPRNSGWAAVNTPAQTILAVEGAVLRARARDLERNSDVINAVIGAVIRNILGQGYQLQAQTPRGRLNDELEGLWAEWCKPRNCDVTGALGFHNLLEMIIRRKIVDGGVLINKVYTRNGPCPFKLQVLEVDALAEPMRPHRQGNTIVQGVEVDRYMRPRGYWVAPYSPDMHISLEPRFLAEKDVVFYFTKQRPSQIREVTDLAPILERVRDANEFAKDVAEKQKVEAKFAAFIKRNVESGAGRGSFLQNRSAKEAERHGYAEIAPGMIFDLAPGEDMGALNPTGQATDAASFMRLLLRLVAAGMGLSYEAVSRDMSGVNYSSARQSAIEDEVSFAGAVAQFMDILHEIYETFVISCVKSGAVSIPDFRERKEDYLAHTWIRIPKRWVDPKKEAEANILLMRAGLKSLPEALGEMGSDWKEALDTIAEVVKYGDKVGIDVGALIYDGKLTGMPSGETARQPGQTGQDDQTGQSVQKEGSDAGGDTTDEGGTADAGSEASGSEPA